MEWLDRTAKNTQRKAYADGTFENLRVQWVKYLEFCIYFNLIAFPASTTVLVWFVQFLGKTVKAHGTVLSHVSGIKKLHILLGFKTSGFRGYLLTMTLCGLRRGNKHIVKRARPMTPSLLTEIHGTLDHSNPIHAIFWCINVLAFFFVI